MRGTNSKHEENRSKKTFRGCEEVRRKEGGENLNDLKTLLGSILNAHTKFSNSRNKKNRPNAKFSGL